MGRGKCLSLVIYMAMLWLLIDSHSACASNDRIATSHNLAWLNTIQQVKINEDINVWAEYHWRRADFFESWQQSLLRAGIQKKMEDNFYIALGYAWAETFPYAKFANKQESPFPEYRIFTQLSMNDDIGIVKVDHRLRYEQRWLGQLDKPAINKKRKIKEWDNMQRMRYQLRLTIPINNNKISPNTLYANLYNELFIGFGKNVKQNVFDQNRIGFTAGYKFNYRLRIETGYFHMFLQQSQLIDNREVFQYNNGFVLTMIKHWK